MLKSTRFWRDEELSGSFQEHYTRTTPSGSQGHTDSRVHFPPARHSGWRRQFWRCALCSVWPVFISRSAVRVPFYAAHRSIFQMYDHRTPGGKLGVELLQALGQAAGVTIVPACRPDRYRLRLERGELPPYRHQRRLWPLGLRGGHPCGCRPCKPEGKRFLRAGPGTRLGKRHTGCDPAAGRHHLD
mgnify:CR=1 FL=1